MTQRRPLESRTETRNVVTTTIVVDHYPRCMYCKYQPILVRMATRPWAQQCRHCKQINYGNSETL